MERRKTYTHSLLTVCCLALLLTPLQAIAEKPPPGYKSATFSAIAGCENARPTNFVAYRKVQFLRNALGCALACFNDPNVCSGISLFFKDWPKQNDLNCYLFTEALSSCSSLKPDERYRYYRKDNIETDPPESSQCMCKSWENMLKRDSSGIVSGDPTILHMNLAAPSVGRLIVKLSDGLRHAFSPTTIKFGPSDAFFQLPPRYSKVQITRLSASSDGNVQMYRASETNVGSRRLDTFDSQTTQREITFFTQKVGCGVDGGTPLYLSTSSPKEMFDSFNDNYLNMGHLLTLHIIPNDPKGNGYDEVFDGHWTIVDQYTNTFATLHAGGVFYSSILPTSVTGSPAYNFRIIQNDGSVLEMNTDFLEGVEEEINEVKMVHWHSNSCWEKIFSIHKSGVENKPLDRTYRLDYLLARGGRISISYVENGIKFTAQALAVFCLEVCRAVLYPRPLLYYPNPFKFGDNGVGLYAHEIVEVFDTDSQVKISKMTYASSYGGVTRSFTSSIDWFSESYYHKIVYEVDGKTNTPKTDTVNTQMQAGSPMRLYILDAEGGSTWVEIEEIIQVSGGIVELHSAHITKIGVGSICSAEDMHTYKFVLMTSPPRLATIGWKTDYTYVCSDNEEFSYDRIIVFAADWPMAPAPLPPTGA